LILPGFEWSVKYKRVPWDAMDGVIDLCRNFLGLVNSEEMLVFRGAPAETILFSGFSWTQRYSWRDVYPYSELDLKLLEKRIVDGVYNEAGEFEVSHIYGHNHFPNPENNYKFQRLKYPNGNYIYDSDNLNKLFFGWDGNGGDPF